MASKTNMRKFIAGSVTAAVVASAIAPAASADVKSFSDIKEGHWAYTEIMALAQDGIINGYPDGTFRSSVILNRGQAANLLTAALDLDIPSDLDAFEDVSDQSVFAEAAAATKAAGIFGGKANGTIFGAGDELTREQMASVIVRAFNLEDTGEEVTFTDSEKISESHKENVKILAQYGITTGKADGSFDPKGNVSRGHFATFLYRAMEMPATEITAISPVADITVVEGEEVVLPEVVEVTYSDDSKEDVAVAWEETDFSAPGEYVVEGTVEGTDLKASVKVIVEKGELIVDSVEATTTKVASGKLENPQFVSFEINKGEAISIQELVEAGYKVEFQSTKAVFEGGKSASETGQLKNELTEGYSFQYKVVVTDAEGKTFESDLQTVTATSADVVVAPTELSLVENGKVWGLDYITIEETPNVVVTKGVNFQGETIDQNTGDNAHLPENVTGQINYSSSNPTVALVSSSGKITPLKAGSTTITVSVNDKSVSYNLTVVAPQKAYSVEENAATIQAGSNQSVELTVLDQYGEKLRSNKTLTVETQTEDSEVVKGLKASYTTDDSKLVVDGLTVAEGTETLVVKSGETTIGTVSLTIIDVSDEDVDGYKLAVADSDSESDDLTLDIFDAADDTVQLSVEEYKGDVKSGVTTAADLGFTLKSLNTDVATVNTENGTVTAVSEGTATIQLLEGSVVRATATVTIENSTPQITSVDLAEDVDAVTILETEELAGFVDDLEATFATELADDEANPFENGVAIKSIVDAEGKLSYNAAAQTLTVADVASDVNTTVVVTLDDNYGGGTYAFDLTIQDQDALAAAVNDAIKAAAGEDAGLPALELENASVEEIKAIENAVNALTAEDVEVLTEKFGDVELTEEDIAVFVGNLTNEEIEKLAAANEEEATETLVNLLKALRDAYQA
ncbi:S-layer homology domain-containing protein [Cytobacillus sp. NCCP-133]|uniref:S-layer homology domain-containing protein n=1 Tax=Cytobacillus sp. NCCP-133 TaxID=766848 RepID=UPI00222FACEB|nr:S-layer homology domain-containing protein [Cytobacillus sp. NCCP-133]GLB60229.1 hypothetical protein NCCP133_23610 [Cytobacillus sp. NCCP-133]